MDDGLRAERQQLLVAVLGQEARHQSGELVRTQALTDGPYPQTAIPGCSAALPDPLNTPTLAGGTPVT